MNPSNVPAHREPPSPSGYHLVIKYHQPRVGMYPLVSAYGDSEILVELEGLVIERLPLEHDEAAEVASRPHVARVVEEGFGSVPPPIPPDALRPAARRLNITDAMEMHRILAVQAAGLRGAGKRMAILDTGIAPWLAEALGARLVARESMVPNEDWRDEGAASGHGTFCSQVPAEVAPDAEIVSIKVLSSREGWGYTSWINRGIARALELGCTSIGMSLGGPGDKADAMSRLVDAAAQQGVFVAAAAGNEQDGSGEYTADRSHPGCADGAFSCAAFDSDRLLAPFSSWGVSVDGAAVGVMVAQGVPEQLWSGTSMATPFVHGVAALIGSGVVSAPVGAVRAAIDASCVDSDYEAYKEGRGFVDAYAACEKAGLIEPPPIEAPQPDEEYLPDLKRRSLSRLRADHDEHVVGTYRGRPVGEWRPRG